MNLKEKRSKIEKGCNKLYRFFENKKGIIDNQCCENHLCSECQASLNTFNECIKAFKDIIEDECAPEGNPLKYRDRMLSQLLEVKL